MARSSSRPRLLHTAILMLLLAVLNPIARATSEGLYRYNEASEVVTDASGRIRGATRRTDKDFIVGGLFPLHSEDAASGGGRCGSIRSEQLMEAMLFALDRINADTELLQSIELGYDIRDTCFSENIGLDEALDLIVSGERLDIGSCSCDTGNASETINTVGIVGAGASKVSVPVASLGRLFEMPQVCYASSSPILSNRDRYTYFYRTIPPDSIQAKVMVDLMLWFNWTHISTVYSDDAYGQPGIAALQELAEDNGICIDVNEGIGEGFVEDDYEALAMKLNASAANTVVLFAHDQHVEQLLEKVRNISVERRFIWIASDTWSRSVAIANKFNETVAGMYGVSPFSPYIQEFQHYLSQLTIQGNLRNPWFSEIFASYAECDYRQNATDTSMNACDKNSNITHFSHYGQSNLVPLTIDAVYTIAHALDDFLMENCNQPMVWNHADNACNGRTRQMNGSALLEYIAKVRFHSPLTGNKVQFDSEGNVEGQYEIWNYQSRNVNGKKMYDFRKVGIWDSSVSNVGGSGVNTSSLNLTDIHTLQFGIDIKGSIVREPPQSHCGHCIPGQYQRPVPSSCCSICNPCLGPNFSSEHLAPSCNSCSLLGDMWGNDPLRGSNSCVAISETFLKFSDPWSIVVIFMAIVGLVSAMGTGIVFGVYFKTPVIKSSSREQMILLLIGIALSFASVFIYIAPPSLSVCILQRFTIWVCFSLMFGAVTIKILRVTRIFLNRSLTRRPRCMDTHHLIIFTFLIVVGQLVLVVASIGYQPPGIRRELRLDSTNTNNFPEIVITCVSDPIPMFVLSVAYEALVIIAACVLGVMSFKFPANFNEAKFISFCTFALLMIWLAFIPSYFSTLSTPEIQNATIALAVVMSAFAVLSCIFGRKIYIVVLRPKDNKRQFTSVYTKADNCTTAIGALTIETSIAFTGHTPHQQDRHSESPSK